MKTRAVVLGVAVVLGAGSASGQSLNLDFGEVANAPPATYGAASGQVGIWNSLLAPHGSTTPSLLDLSGTPTAVSVRQLGGTDNVTVDDIDTVGDDALLMDDYLVTFSEPIETCLFFENLIPGEYDVYVYAWMPGQPTIKSLTSVDQEPGIPHYQVGGAWPGGHQELVTYALHHATVGADGILNMHSGIAPGADPADGAALNAIQLVRRGEPVFSDGFETGDTAAWTTTFGP